MCGIDIVVSDTDGKNYKPIENIKNRGPDDLVKVKCNKCLFVFYRLVIVGGKQGRQPFISRDKGTITVCNGEIYNHKEIMQEIRQLLERKNRVMPVCQAEDSDCFCIHAMFNAGISPRSIPNYLRGEFAFVHFDGTTLYFARDMLGKKALYLGLHNGRLTRISSAIQAFDPADKIYHVRPGCLYQYNVQTCKLTVERYIMSFEDRFVAAMAGPSISMKQKYTLENIPKDEATINRELFETLCEAVEIRTRQMDEVCKVGFMLSGGFDSSLVLSLALAGGIKRPVQAYTFGFEKDADDVKSARVMVDWVKAKYGPDAIDWHLVHRPVSDGLHALSQVIKSIETYDTTTVRASTPMYLLSQAMQQDGIRVILSGEGADELFGGYLYFKCAPNHKEYISEIGFLLDHLFEADCLRADRATAAWSTEVRFPFLDEEFVDRVIKANIIQNDPQNTKMTLRKLVPEGFLPPSIHWGKKEAFSDAVGHSWKDSILAFAESELKKYPNDLPAQHAAPNDLHAQLNDKTKPRTKEEEFYQKVFVSTFGDRRTILSRYWMPNWIEAQDPSARVLKVYQDNPIAKS